MPGRKARVYHVFYLFHLFILKSNPSTPLSLAQAISAFGLDGPGPRKKLFSLLLCPRFDTLSIFWRTNEYRYLSYLQKSIVNLCSDSVAARLWSERESAVPCARVWSVAMCSEHPNSWLDHCER